MMPVTVSAGAPPRDRVEWTGIAALVGLVGALQLSIFVAEILLTVVLICWAVSLVAHRERVQFPSMFVPLMVYGGLTLISAIFSTDPLIGLKDSRQLFLFLLVPAVYDLARGRRATTIVDVIVTVGAASAALGIIQYGVLQYDNLGQRPRGTLGHYMTYSGLLMLVICTAAARILFGRRDRLWSALVMPALLVAVVVTFTRSAWVGACAAVAVLCLLKDFRLIAVGPLVIALFFALAPARLTSRFYSMFDLQNLSNRDRVAMLKAGSHIIRDHPMTGVGPDMIERVYPQYRESSAVEMLVPHLHNVPVQIAAERGIPALIAWLWFIGMLLRDLWRKTRRSLQPFLPAAGLAAVVAMLAAGMFEYNFGDSEFLMLFLVLVTLPYAADRDGLLS